MLKVPRLPIWLERPRLAVDEVPVANPLPERAATGPPTGTPAHRGHVDLAEAEEFLRLYHAENPETGPVGPRLP